jgi:hypothetical protein
MADRAKKLAKGPPKARGKGEASGKKGDEDEREGKLQAVVKLTRQWITLVLN